MGEEDKLSVQIDRVRYAAKQLDAAAEKLDIDRKIKWNWLVFVVGGGAVAIAITATIALICIGEGRAGAQISLATIAVVSIISAAFLTWRVAPVAELLLGHKLSDGRRRQDAQCEPGAE
ncbi:Uncharacterised protein (plasmid) [Tsukamurella tyrosinosolvens]|uniref:hypothetical protein n=1 Tax=Tsukamurella tyrosinosolvens TaxID=57704 RepID=UPI0007973874|nr:hypothetical protein [Tsukamurella tyrosinosolvens]KXO98821.1 hypothetical protein AXK58_24435 [Tsukamurella tyrosinosolvens]VEH95811.1 Uncharacterised protein [Tsukamurella tyrosinosolvens]